MTDQNGAHTHKPLLSLLLGILYVAAGAFAAVVCLYSTVTNAWPLGAMYLFGLFGGVWTFVMGLSQIRALSKKEAL